MDSMILYMHEKGNKKVLSYMTLKPCEMNISYAIFYVM